MELKVGDTVNIVIGRASGLGVMVLINELEEGLIYRNEIFQPLVEGEKMEAYVKNIREDGKIDISLQPQGFRNVIELNMEKVLDSINEHNGFLPLTDKSTPGAIKRELEMSKKSFKSAVGGLFKQKKIIIREDGIILNK
ncbi:MAG: DNA-binding protein [Flavobacteriaceae bacterium]|nr:DNA-binding protein [Flavobacteriaceae bacterium]